MFLIPIPNNFMAEKCTNTCNRHITSIISYLYYIVFDWDTFFMTDHFND